MDTLKIQDVFEPYYEGRKKRLSRIDPRAVEKARQARDRIEQAGKAEQDKRDRAA